MFPPSDIPAQMHSFSVLVCCPCTFQSISVALHRRTVAHWHVLYLARIVSSHLSFGHTANQQHNSNTRHIFILLDGFSTQSCHQTKYVQSIQPIIATPAQNQYSDSHMRAIVANITTTIDLELRHPSHPNTPPQSFPFLVVPFF